MTSKFVSFGFWKRIYTSVLLELLNMYLRIIARILILLLVSCLHHARAANPDSLKKLIISLENGGEKRLVIEKYQELARQYISLNQYREGLKASLTGLELAEEEKDWRLWFSLSGQTGWLYYFAFDDYPEALKYLIQADQNRDSSVSESMITKNLATISLVYLEMGNYSLALEYQFDALQRFEELDDEQGISQSLRSLGIIYRQLSHYDRSISYLKKALSLQNNKDNPFELMAIAATITETFLEQKNYDSASVYAAKTYLIADSVGELYGVAYASGLKGKISRYSGDSDTAFFYLDKAKKLFGNLGIKKELAEFTLEKAGMHLQKKQYSFAEEELNIVNGIITETDDMTLKKDYYKIRSLLHESMGDTEEALRYIKLFIQCQDSLFNEKIFARVSELENRYAVMDKEKEIETLQLERQSTQRKLTLYGILIGVLLLMGLLWMVYVRNKTLREINQVLAQKNEEIRLQNERLASSNDDLRQFAHVTSHDLREPLRSIGSFASLLEMRYKEQIDEEASEFISFITGGVKRMDKLLSDLLAYSVVGIFNHEYTQVNTAEIIEMIIKKLHLEKATQGVRISIQDLPVITASYKHMVQLFEHLIDNSIKFRSEDKPEIMIKAEKHGDEYLFSVKDNGIGMDEAYKEKIFGLFLRLHNKKSKYTGTGVGLSICKKIVEQHKGKIWIESKLGEGTTVFFRLPESPVKPDNQKLRKKFSLSPKI